MASLHRTTVRQKKYIFFVLRLAAVRPPSAEFPRCLLTGTVGDRARVAGWVLSGRVWANASVAASLAVIAARARHVNSE